MVPERIGRFLVVGLGNPGETYRFNRHNVGWLFLDALAGQLLPREAFRPCSGLSGEFLEGRWAGRHLVLLKPQTYMNLSGTAVTKALARHNVPSDGLVVAYDDADLPFGTIRIRQQGTSGGHRGIGSVIESLGTEAIKRIRIGIRPEGGGSGTQTGKRDLVDYVLSDFSQEETERLPEVLDTCVATMKEIMRGGIGRAMNRFNSRKRKDEAEASECESAEEH